MAKAIFYADLRTKVAIYFMAFSGLRPSVLAKEDGGDRLTVDDLVMGNPGDPVEVWVRTELSKIEWRYVTFFPSSLRPCSNCISPSWRRGEVNSLALSKVFVAADYKMFIYFYCTLSY